MASFYIHFYDPLKLEIINSICQMSFKFFCLKDRVVALIWTVFLHAKMLTLLRYAILVT